MTQTTTNVNACDAVIQVDNSSGTLTDISGSSNQVSITNTLNVGEAFTLGDKYPVRNVCGKDSTLELTVVYSTAADEGADLIETWYQTGNGTARSVQLDVPDSTSGSKRYSGEFILSEYSMDLAAGEGAPIMLNASLVPDGAVTISTISS